MGASPSVECIPDSEFSVVAQRPGAHSSVVRLQHLPFGGELPQTISSVSGAYIFSKDFIYASTYFVMEILGNAGFQKVIIMYEGHSSPFRL